jgi:hypothetical protein
MLLFPSVRGHKLLLILSILFSVIRASAQPDCRSVLGSHIKPAGATPLSWGIELSATGALMNDRTLSNWSVYTGLDFTLKKNQIYFEGAYKDWYNSAKNPDGNEARVEFPEYNRPSPKNFGFRELFYRYGSRDSYIKTGIQSFKSSDYLLFDERLLGITAVKALGSVQAAMLLGSVSQDIARFQDVCGNRHIYNILHRSAFNFTGDKLWESNLGGAFITWKPGKHKDAQNTSESFDEFNSDEFFASDESTNQEKKYIKVEEAGLFFYEEFGSGFHTYKYYSGFFSTFALPMDISMKSEVIDQYIRNDHAITYFLKLEKMLTWNSGANSRVNIGYLGKVDIDEDAHFYPSFSNLFLGEIMRLDAIDLPLLSSSFKHHFTGKLKPTLQFNAVKQLSGNQSQEIDLLLGSKMTSNLRITGIFSYLNSEILHTDYWMTKLEIRFAF